MKLATASMQTEVSDDAGERNRERAESGRILASQPGTVQRSLISDNNEKKLVQIDQLP
jgi:hypothetical protein